MSYADSLPQLKLASSRPVAFALNADQAKRRDTRQREAGWLWGNGGLRAISSSVTDDYRKGDTTRECCRTAGIIQRYLARPGDSNDACFYNSQIPPL